jgi:hypothetical protein
MGRVNDFVCQTSGRPLLLHNVRSGSISNPTTKNARVHTAGIAVTAAYPMEDIVQRHSTLLSGKQPFEQACFSSAPLKEVASVDVFSDGEFRICTGILLRYADGTRRSLGQCRLGYDDVTHVEEPIYWCYTPTTYRLANYHGEISGFLVQFLPRELHCHQSSAQQSMEWTCYGMEGTVEFWFNSTSMQLNIVN